MAEYEYRPMKRAVGDEAWSEIITNRGGGRAYQVVGSARGVLTREKKDDTRWGYAYEYKLQRRPLGEWEDFQ